LLSQPTWPLRMSVSVTTRRPRPGEIAGAHYHFWTREAFEQELAVNGFLEWAEVFSNYYGTLRREVEPFREQGMGVLLEIDVKGWEQVRRHHPEAVSVFIRTSSMGTYEKRLRRRRTEMEDAIQRRLAGARLELERAGEYDHQVINDDKDQALSSLNAIVNDLFKPGDKRSISPG